MIATVFLPGTLCDERVFAHQFPLFSGHVAVNLREDNSIEAMIERVRSTQADQFNLIGFSMGGRVAQEFAVLYPERVRKMVVIASSADAYPPKEREIVKAALPMIQMGKFKGISEKRLRDYLGPLAYQDQQIKDLIQDMAGSDAKEVYLRQLEATLNRADFYQGIQRLTVPSLFIAAREDKIVPYSTIVKTAEIAPGSRLETIENCGHFIPLEAPEQVNELIVNFLDL